MWVAVNCSNKSCTFKFGKILRLYKYTVGPSCNELDGSEKKIGIDFFLELYQC